MFQSICLASDNESCYNYSTFNLNDSRLNQKEYPLLDVLLIHPKEGSKSFGGMAPLGLCWIASYLESKGISNEIVDLHIFPEDIPSLVTRHHPRVVGIGGTTHTRFESFRIAREVKACDASITVLYGGPHASFTATDTLEHVPAIDIVVRGEGEQSAQKIVSQVLAGTKEFSRISGISYRGRNGIVHTKSVSRIQNLDSLPFPRRSLDTWRRYNLTMEFSNDPGASMITSRGCPVNCTFCSASAMFGTTTTFRSASNAVDEIEMLVNEYGARGIKFFDSTLTLKRSHIESLCAEIRRRKLHVPWECEIRVNTVDYNLLKTMREAGCYYVDFGIESASQRVLKTMHKNIRVEQAVNVLRWTKELGIFTKVFFTFGHIGETLTDSFETIAFMERNAACITVAATGIGIRIYPGTDVESHARAIGCLAKDFSWSVPFAEQNTRALGNDPIVPILIQPQFGWDEFARVESRLAQFWLRNPRLTYNAFRSHLRLQRGRQLASTILHAARMQMSRRLTRVGG